MSSAEQIAEEISSYVGERIYAAMDECGAQWADDLRKAISVPVGRNGSYIVRSLPGEPPRTEHGDYLDSTLHQTRASLPFIITEIGSILPNRGVWLEGGTGRILPRPHYTPLYDRLQSEAAETIHSKLKE